MFNRIECTINKIMEYFFKEDKNYNLEVSNGIKYQNNGIQRTIQFTHQQISPVTNINKYLCH